MFTLGGRVDKTFSCNFIALELDQPKICGELQPVSRGPWETELVDMGIVFIGADVAVGLLTIVKLYSYLMV